MTPNSGPMSARQLSIDTAVAGPVPWRPRRRRPDPARRPRQARRRKVRISSAHPFLAGSVLLDHL